MPIVRVWNWHLSNSDLRNAVEALPGLVSEALTVPGNADAELTPEDIKVIVEKSDTADIRCPDNCQTLTVIVEARYFPERASKIREATDEIKRGLAKILPATYIPIGIGLSAVAGFGEIPPVDKG